MNIIITDSEPHAGSNVSNPTRFKLQYILRPDKSRVDLSTDSRKSSQDIFYSLYNSAIPIYTYESTMFWDNYKNNKPDKPWM